MQTGLKSMHPVWRRRQRSNKLPSAAHLPPRPSTCRSHLLVPSTSNDERVTQQYSWGGVGWGWGGGRGAAGVRGEGAQSGDWFCRWRSRQPLGCVDRWGAGVQDTLGARVGEVRQGSGRKRDIDRQGRENSSRQKAGTRDVGGSVCIWRGVERHHAAGPRAAAASQEASRRGAGPGGACQRVGEAGMGCRAPQTFWSPERWTKAGAQAHNSRLRRGRFATAAPQRCFTRGWRRDGVSRRAGPAAAHQARVLGAPHSAGSALAAPSRVACRPASGAGARLQNLVGLLRGNVAAAVLHE